MGVDFLTTQMFFDNDEMCIRDRSRTVSMAGKYFEGGRLPAEQAEGPEDAELIALCAGVRDRYEQRMEKFAFQEALVDVFAVVSRANK